MDIPTFTGNNNTHKNRAIFSINNKYYTSHFSLLVALFAVVRFFKLIDCIFNKNLNYENLSSSLTPMVYSWR